MACLLCSLSKMSLTLPKYLKPLRSFVISVSGRSKIISILFAFAQIAFIYTMLTNNLANITLGRERYIHTYIFSFISS